MTDAHAIVFLRWFWAGFFVVFGIFQMTRGRNFLSASTADCFLKVSGPEAERTVTRIEAAVERRQAAEGTRVPLGLWMGWFSFLLAAVAATGTVHPPTVLYAVLCLGMSLGVAAIFLRLRNSQAMRVALLSARSVDSVMPSYWFVAAVISALSLLAYTTDSQYRLAAILVSVSSLISVALAWRLANLPALLSGIDIPAEQIVDDRLRFYRSRSAMVFAVAETFVFCAQALGERNPAQLVSYLITTVLFFAFAAWMFRRQFAKVRLA